MQWQDLCQLDGMEITTGKAYPSLGFFLITFVLLLFLMALIIL